MALEASVSVVVRAEQTGSNDLSSPVNSLLTKFLTQFADGVGLNQANKIWADERTLSASAAEDLDLGGGLTDAFGTALTFTEIKGIIIKADAGNTNNVVLGGDTNALVNFVGAANDLINIRPGGLLCLLAPDATGYAVTADTGDIIQVANSSSGTSVTYQIILIGN